MNESAPKTPGEPFINTVPPKDAAARETTAPPLDSLSRTYTPPAPEREHETEHSRPDQTPWWKHLMELAAILIGIAVAIIYYGQLSTMNRQLTEMQQTRIQSQTAFDATVQQFHLDQRAWVAAVGISSPPAAGRPFDVAVRVRNTGKTFAKNFGTVLTVEPLKRSEAPDFAGELIEPKSVTVLAPNGDYLSTSHTPITTPAGIIPTLTVERLQDLKNQLRAGDLKIFAHGRISYRDIFGCRHWTTFCFNLTPDWEYVSCSTHNDTDETSCSRQP